MILRLKAECIIALNQLPLSFEMNSFRTLQELHYRGYYTRGLFEGVDTYSGSVEHKQQLFQTLFPFWGRTIFWDEIKTEDRTSC